MLTTKPSAWVRTFNRHGLLRLAGHDRRRLRYAAELLLAAAITQVQFHFQNDGYGCAWSAERVVRCPWPRKLCDLHTVAHECGHVVLGHKRIQNTHRKEFEAEIFAKEAMRKLGLRSKIGIANGRAYVAKKIKGAVCRGARRLYAPAVNHAGGYLSPVVLEWLQMAVLEGEWHVLQE